MPDPLDEMFQWTTGRVGRVAEPNPGNHVGRFAEHRRPKRAVRTALRRHHSQNVAIPVNHQDERGAEIIGVARQQPLNLVSRPAIQHQRDPSAVRRDRSGELGVGVLPPLTAGRCRHQFGSGGGTGRCLNVGGLSSVVSCAMNSSPHHPRSTADLDGTYLPSDWARSRIAAWLESAAPALVLTGPAGGGKTALTGGLAGWVGVPCAVHHCRARSLASTDPVTVMAGITAALCRVVPGYADAVISQRPRRRGQPVPAGEVPNDRLAVCAVLDSPDGYAAYDRALHQPFSMLSGSPAGQVLVVIDGVDEVSDRGGGLLVDVLAARAATRTPHLRLLLTGRPGHEVRRFRDHAQIDLADDPSTPDAIRTVLASVPGLSAKAQRAVAAAAQGSFWYGLLVARSPDLVARPPDGIDAAYGRLVADLDPLSRQVLEVVCASWNEGLTATDLGGVLAAGEDQIDAALARIRRLVLWGRRFRPHHRCLAEYAARRSPPPDGAIAEHFIHRYGGQWESCADRYPLRNLLPHLADAAFREWAGRGTSANSARMALAAALDNTRYLTTALAGAGVGALRAALSYVRYHVAGAPRESARATSLGLMLSDNSHLLRDGAAGAVNQLVYTALSTGDYTLAAGLATAVDDSAVQALWATNDEIVSASDRFRGHDAKVTGLIIATNGTHAFSASTDGTTRRWRLASGRPDRVLPTPGRVAYVHSGSDATEFFAAYKDGTAQAWDTHTGDGRSLNGRSILVTAFAISGDATRALSADKDRGITLWALEDDAEPLWRSPRQPERVTSLALTADGRHGASAIANGEVTVWDLSTGQVHLRLRHTSLVTTLCLTPPGDRLVIGDDETLTVIDTTIASGAARAGETARLVVRAAVTAIAANPVLDRFVLLGTASGQIAYVRVP
jgi:WD40 repeat protein